MENIKEGMERKLDIAKLKLMNFLNFSICFFNFFPLWSSSGQRKSFSSLKGNDS